MNKKDFCLYCWGAVCFLCRPMNKLINQTKRTFCLKYIWSKKKKRKTKMFALLPLTKYVQRIWCSGWVDGFFYFHFFPYIFFSLLFEEGMLLQWTVRTTYNPLGCPAMAKVHTTNKTSTPTQFSWKGRWFLGSM